MVMAPSPSPVAVAVQALDDGRAVLGAGGAHDAERPGELVRADLRAPVALERGQRRLQQVAERASSPAFITSRRSSTRSRPSRSASASARASMSRLDLGHGKLQPQQGRQVCPEKSRG